MRAFDFEAVAHDGAVYCVERISSGVSAKEVSPIFADSEWDFYPSCDSCGLRFTYVNLTTEGQKYEGVL